MILEYDEQADAASVLVGPPIVPGGNHHKEPIDADRLIRYNDDDGTVLQYEFLSVREYRVRLDDIKNPEHRAELARLFREAGFSERDWSDPVPQWTPRARGRAAG